MKMKKIKAWAVVWTEKGREEYGVSGKQAIIDVEPREAIKIDIRKNKKMGRPAIRYTNASAIFPTRKEAEAYREFNMDWISVPCTITYKLPTKE